MAKPQLPRKMACGAHIMHVYHITEEECGAITVYIALQAYSNSTDGYA